MSLTYSLEKIIVESPRSRTLRCGKGQALYAAAAIKDETATVIAKHFQPLGRKGRMEFRL